MDAPGSAIALWGFNGTMPQSGTELSKEFNPENPPLGSTIVATFVWTGSSNVITSVTDELWTGRQVGNSYNLVEYVTAGGISMATYVATNVQNYPYPKDVLGDELLIRAHLSTAVAGGGTLVSAYTGVNPVFAQALGAHRSGTGSGSTTPTVAHPGTIAVGAGALAYAVSMTSEGLAGRTAPAGFTYLTNISMDSPPLQFDVEYTVPSAATSLDPAWGWSFNSSNTWLATAIALNPAGSSNQPPVAAFTPSCSSLSCGFTSTSSDPDGTIGTYSWTFGDGQTSALQNPSHSYGAGGDYTVTLTVTDNQGATDGTSQSVTVAAANQSPVAAFTSSCPALTCTFSNSSSDPDGSVASQSWTFGDGATSQAVSPSHSYAAAGTYSVTLQVTDNQGATNSITHNVTVAAANQPPVAAFSSSCSALTCTFTSTSSDPDGSISAYSWTFGDGGTSAAQNPSHTYGTAGSYSVTLTVTDNQGATNAISHGVSVAPANQPPVAAFTSSCSALTCNFTSSSTDPDGAITGYSWTFGDGATSTMQNPGHTYNAGGTYTVTLQVTDNQNATNAVSHTVTTAATSPRIALDQFNGTLNERDTAIFAKGFNPTNPRLGDAVVATIFWVGPATLVSVSDFMTNSQRTPVGNTFHLVESVTHGGISMATYVATNIQGFPEPNPDPTIVYAIQAQFSQTVPDGGLLISAYSGVDPNYATAFAGSQSTSGTGTGITPADPGPLTVGAGTLVYSVAMSNGLFGSDKPTTPFADLGGGMSDAAMVADGVYAVPAVAGPSHPRWTYYYDAGQYAWLTSVLALNPAR